MMDGGSTDDEAGTAVDPIGADVRADHRFDAMAEVYYSRNRRDVQLAGVFCAAVRAAAAVGPAVIATPSFGYLIAFPFEAAVTSAAAGRLVNQKGGRYISVLIGVAVSYVIALPYVALLKGVYINAPVSLGVLLSAYCFAFLPLDIVKALLAAALAGRLEKPLGLTKSR